MMDARTPPTQREVPSTDPEGVKVRVLKRDLVKAERRGFIIIIISKG